MDQPKTSISSTLEGKSFKLEVNAQVPALWEMVNDSYLSKGVLVILRSARAQWLHLQTYAIVGSYRNDSLFDSLHLMIRPRSSAFP